MSEKDNKDIFAFPPDTRDPDEMDFGKKERTEIEKRLKRRSLRDAGDLRKVLESVEGRRVLARILYKSCVFNEFGDIIDSSFNSNSMTMAWTEGSRRIGFSLLNDIRHANSNALLQMQRERESDLKDSIEK